jgi:hypothetical protein
MKIFLFFIFLFVFCLSNNNNNENYNNEIFDIIPNNQLRINNIKLNKEILLKTYIKNFKENHYYKIMIHFIGSLGISFDINIICDDIYYIKNLKKENNINLNDFDEFDFKVNKNKIPDFCNKEFKYDFILISILPKSKTYQLIPEEKILFSSIIELIENKINTNNKIINILTNKNLYIGLIFIFLISILFLIFQNKIKKLLIDSLQYQIHVH